MRKGALTVIIALLGAVAAESEIVRTLEETLSLESKETLDLDLPMGELRVEGKADGPAEVTVEIECSKWRRRCLRAAEDIEIAVRRGNQRLRVEIDGWPQWGTSGMSMNVLARVPQTSPLEVDLGIGQVVVTGLRSDLFIDVGIGKVEVDMDADFIRSVHLESGIGDSSMTLAGEAVGNKRSFLGDELRWSEGTGSARIKIDLGIGAIDVDLD